VKKKGNYEYATSSGIRRGGKKGKHWHRKTQKISIFVTTCYGRKKVHVKEWGEGGRKGDSNCLLVSISRSHNLKVELGPLLRGAVEEREGRARRHIISLLTLCGPRQGLEERREIGDIHRRGGGKTRGKRYNFA